MTAPQDAASGERRQRPAEGATLPATRGQETGDRGRFLAGARQRLAGGIHVNPVHPPPLVSAPGDPVPLPRYRNLEADDLPGTFAAAVEHAGGTCHVVRHGPLADAVPDDLLDRLVAELDVPEAVVTDEPEARAVGARLAARGMRVQRADRTTAAGAGLGVTAAVAGIAATGTVVLDHSRPGVRAASLLPGAHLCVVDASRLHPTPADVLRTLGAQPGAQPALVLVTGPSRTGDIEQLLTLGAHGPTALHVVLVT